MYDKGNELCERGRLKRRKIGEGPEGLESFLKRLRMRFCKEVSQVMSNVNYVKEGTEKSTTKRTDCLRFEVRPICLVQIKQVVGEVPVSSLIHVLRTYVITSKLYGSNVYISGNHPEKRLRH